MGGLSDKLLQLRPVTFRYKKAAEDGSHPLQYGLIAEEVAKIYPDLVQYDKQGKPFTIYYHLLTPMLLNALQKEHRAILASNSAHKSEMAALNAAHSAEMAAMRAELTSLKEAQQQQVKMLAKLAEFVQSPARGVNVRKTFFVQH